MATRSVPALSRRAERLVNRLYDLEAHVSYIREQIGTLSPVSTLDRLLRGGKVTTEWYAQRLSDIGMTLPEIIDEVSRLTNLPGGSEISPIPADWVAMSPPSWRIRMHVGRRPSPRTASHRPPSHTILIPGTDSWHQAMEAKQ